MGMRSSVSRLYLLVGCWCMQVKESSSNHNKNIDLEDLMSQARYFLG
jgi:hypothetical protein